MQRRRFIRVLGGGVIVAAGAAGSACSRAHPPAAIAPWRGPQEQDDVRRWIVAYAILAPHSHNLQSWIVDLREPGRIVLRCDPQRVLPHTDPYARQIMMSHGTFVELIHIAARERGLRADVELFPQGEFGPTQIDPRPVARITLEPDGTAKKDALFAQILKRHTNRERYELQRPVPEAAWAAMAEAVKPYTLRFGHVDAAQAALLQQHRDIAAAAWRIELTTPRTILESYKWLRVGAKEVEQHRDGIALMDPMVVWMDRLGLFDRSQAPAPDDFATTSQIEDFGDKLDSTPAFLWMVSEGNARSTQVDAGRAYVRVQLAATAHGLAMQPLQQALQEYAEQAGLYAQIHQLLEAPPPRETVQMWARVGYAPPVQPAPRRGVEAQLAAS